MAEFVPASTERIVTSDTARAQQQRLTGAVVWFKPDKGFGFIAIDGENRDIFMHASDWVHDRDPCQGDRVSFIEATDNSGRPRACQVVVVE